MRKTKSNARWNSLTSEKQKALDHLLFEEKLSYTEVLPRAQKELGFKGQLSSLKRYYERRRKERTVMEFTDLCKRATEIVNAPGDAGAYRTASMKLLTAYLFQQVREAPNDVDKWGSVAHLIVDNDHNEAMRELKGAEHEIRREALDFAREKFQFDMIERAVRALPELQKLAQAMEDADLTRYRNNPHWNEARYAMFGPCTGVLPEKAPEENKASASTGDTVNKEPSA
jgi:hypothetical protein